MATPPVETATELNPAMPNEHQVHHVVFFNEQQNRLHAFESGIIALRGEHDSRQAAFDAAAAERDRIYNEAKLAAEQEHSDEMAALDRRIEDMIVGREMAEAAIAVYEKRKAGDAA